MPEVKHPLFKQLTRDDLVHEIKTAGQYIVDHAENLLGEYPSLLSEMDLVVHFRFDEATTIEVNRIHLVCDKQKYPIQQQPWYARGGIFEKEKQANA